MGRKQAIIIFPHLNDHGGDLNKKWYVEYKWRVPGETVLRQERFYRGLFEGTKQYRYKLAAKALQKSAKSLAASELSTGFEIMQVCDLPLTEISVFMIKLF